MVTPEAFAAALCDHPRIADAARACGITKTWVYQRPDLRAIAQAHVAAGRRPRNAARQLGCHGIALSADVLARIDAYRAEMARRVGPARASRAAAVREIVAAALRRREPLPRPTDAEGEVIVLDLGEVWDKVGHRSGTTEPQRIAGIVRAILDDFVLSR